MVATLLTPGRLYATESMAGPTILRFVKENKATDTIYFEPVNDKKTGYLVDSTGYIPFGGSLAQFFTPVN